MAVTPTNTVKDLHPSILRDAAKLAEEAADILLVQGWTRGTLRNAANEVCVTGALAKAAYNNKSLGIKYPTYDQDEYDLIEQDPILSLIADTAKTVMLEEIDPERTLLRTWTDQSEIPLWRFNDTVHTYKHETDPLYMRDVLMKVAKKLTPSSTD